MASTYSTNLRLELIGTGEQQGTWGATTNVNLGTLLEEAIGGYISVTVSDVADTTLTANNGSADQSRNMVLNLTGTISATRNVICPAIEKLYVVKNATTGGYAVTFKVTGQTGVSIPNGSTVFVYVDGTDVRAITGSMASQSASSVAITGGSITGITDLAVADGGTGASNAGTARSNLGAAASGANTDLTSIYLDNTGLKVKDTNASHGLSIVPGSDLTADRTLTVTTGDASRTITMSGDLTLNVATTVTAAGAALLDDADASAQRTTLGLGTASTLNVGTSANNVVQLDGSARLPAVDGSQLTGISAGFTMPPGAVMPYAGSTEPSGWLFCYGQNVSRSTYSALFSALGTTYGAGDGSTTFGLPDLRGRVVAGQDDMGGTSANRLTGQSGGVDGDILGGTGGAETHTLTEAQMPSHSHTFTSRSGSGGSSALLFSTGVSTLNTITTSAAGSDQAHNNVQPTLILNYIIKT